MKKRFSEISLILMTIVIVLIVGLKYDGNLSHLLKQRADFISNIQMGGNRYIFSFSNLKYYISYITEPFALLNILGNIVPFIMLSFFAYGAFSNKKMIYTWIYCFFVGIGIELFQYFTWFGVFDISDIVLRLVGTLIGVFICFCWNIQYNA